MNEFIIDQTVKDFFDDIKNMCSLLAKYRKSTFAAAAKVEKINKWEEKNNIHLPSEYKSWLLLTGHARIMGGYFDLFFPETIKNTDEVLLGSIIGDGEDLFLSKTTGQIYSEFEGDITEYDDFSDFLSYLLGVLEENAEELCGESLEDLYAKFYPNNN